MSLVKFAIWVRRSLNCLTSSAMVLAVADLADTARPFNWRTMGSIASVPSSAAVRLLMPWSMPDFLSSKSVARSDSVFASKNLIGSSMALATDSPAARRPWVRLMSVVMF